MTTSEGITVAEFEIDDADLLPIEGDEPAAEAKSSSLDDAITAALDGAEAGDDAPADGRERDENGRFKPKDKVLEADAAPDGTSDAKPPVASAETPPTNAQPEISEGHFRGWSPEQREAFKALPPEAQKIALDVVKGRDEFYGKQLTDYDQALRATVPLVNAVQPHLDRIQQVTQDPSAYVAHVLNIDYKLQYAPFAEKVQLFTQLAHQSGVPFAPPQPDPFTDPLTPGGEAYPVVHDLKTKVQQLESQLAQYQRQQETLEQQQTAHAISSFASQANADGSPKYPFFRQVKGTMGELLTSGRAQTMEEAYAVAVKPIEEQIAAKAAASARAAEAAQKAALEKARKVRHVRTSGVAPGGKTKSGGLDAILNASLDRAGFN